MRRSATLRASPSARPTWLSAVRYDRATGPMVIDWLGFGSSQVMITPPFGADKREGSWARLPSLLLVSAAARRLFANSEAAPLTEAWRGEHSARALHAAASASARSAASATPNSANTAAWLAAPLAAETAAMLPRVEADAAMLFCEGLDDDHLERT